LHPEDGCSKFPRSIGNVLLLYDATSETVAIFIVTALRTSNSAQWKVNTSMYVVSALTIEHRGPEPALKRFFFIIILSGVRLSPFGTAATTGLLYQPQMIDEVIVEQSVE
jgi:hypothetical protein